MSTSAEDGGFSLVEVLVAMALFLLIGTLTLNAIVTGFRSQSKLSERSSAMSELRTAAQRISRDIRESDVADARDRTLVVLQPLTSGYRELAWSVVGTDLVQTERTLNAAGAVTATLGTETVLQRVDPTASLFGYKKASSYTVTSGSGVSSTCTISGITPVRYSANCIGRITLRLSRTLATGPSILLDQTVELRNA